MGPRLFRRGNRNIPDDFSHSFQASMGPRLFRRGNVEWFWYGHKASSCFNGATSFQTWKSEARERARAAEEELQWGHVFSDVEMREPQLPCIGRVSGFNGATSFQTWKSPSLQPTSMGWPSFNGATSFQTWKYFPPRSRWTPTPSASMGPRLFRRGNLLSGFLVHLSDHRFNGATSFQTWKFHAPARGWCRRRRELQWGHVFSDVEITK